MNDLDDLAPRRDSLGSLTQAARSKSLKSAQRTLFIIGALMMIVFGAQFLMAATLVDAEIEKERKALKAGEDFDSDELQEMREQQIRAVRLLTGAFFAASVVFFVLGFFISKAPVLCTVLGLVIYLAAWFMPVVLALMADEKAEAAKAAFGGIIVKVIVIVVLAKAVQSAIAYQKESRQLGLAE